MKTPSVLLIDPYEDARHMYAEYLRAVDLRPIEIGDTAAALARAQEADIIVTGIRVPGPFDGIELVRRLRGSDATRWTPVIVLSACVLERERNRALEAGCSTFLPKPCLPDVLLNQIRILLASTAPRQITPPSPSAKSASSRMAGSRQKPVWFRRLLRSA